MNIYELAIEQEKRLFVKEHFILHDEEPKYYICEIGEGPKVKLYYWGISEEIQSNSFVFVSQEISFELAKKLVKEMK